MPDGRARSMCGPGRAPACRPARRSTPAARLPARRLSGAPSSGSAKAVISDQQGAIATPSSIARQPAGASSPKSEQRLGRRNGEHDRGEWLRLLATGGDQPPPAPAAAQPLDATAAAHLDPVQERLHRRPHRRHAAPGRPAGLVACRPAGGDAGRGPCREPGLEGGVARPDVLGAMVEQRLPDTALGEPAARRLALVEEHRPMAAVGEHPGTGGPRHPGTDDRHLPGHRALPSIAARLPGAQCTVSSRTSTTPGRRPRSARRP